MLIKELTNDERPRERLLNYGAKALSDSELLAIIIGTGSRDKSAVTLAAELISDGDTGLAGLAGLTIEEISAYKGVGAAKACRIAAAIEIGRRLAVRPKQRRLSIEDSSSVAALFMEDMRYYSKEFLNVLLLNAKGEILSREKVSVGDLTSSVATPREILNPAVRKSAAAIVIVHNHPSGDPCPSSCDDSMTKRVKKAADILGISMLDHIIIGDGVYFSYRDHNLI